LWSRLQDVSNRNYKRPPCVFGVSYIAMSSNHEVLFAPTEEAPLTPEIIRVRDIGIVFPGQGSQFVGMGQQLAEQSPAALAIFKQADEVLPFSLSQICFEGPAETLAETGIAQLAIATVSVAAHAAVLEAFPNFRPVVGGGVSFGELPNLVAAGVIDFSTLLRLVQQRGAIMEEAARENPGRMVAVIGLDNREEIEAACRETDTYPAIWYPGLTIVSGGKEEIDKAVEYFGKNGVKVAETGVLYPFHTPLMAKAEEKLRQALSKIQFNNSLYPIVLNATGEITTAGDKIKQTLPQQLTNAVDTVRTLTIMRQLGATVFLELCPKPVIAPRIRRLLPDAISISIHDAKSLQSLRQLLAG